MFSPDISSVFSILGRLKQVGALEQSNRDQRGMGALRKMMDGEEQRMHIRQRGEGFYVACQIGFRVVHIVAHIQS